MPAKYAFGQHSISRRRMVGMAATGSAGLMGAALIGCSSGPAATPAGSPAAGGAQQPGGTAAPATGQPKHGGTFRYPFSADIETLDRYRGSAPRGWSLPTHFTHSRLLKFDNGKGQPAAGNIVGDLAIEWEQPDPQTVVFHLNPEAKFDPRPPTNSRQVSADDVVASWKRYAAEAAERTTLSHAANPNASVMDIEAIDASTVRVTLAFPDALALSGLAGVSSLWVQPMEGINGEFDQTRELRGSGPFMLESYQPAVGMSFSRSPHWHGGNNQPYLDGVNVSIIPETAQAEVQFRAKNLHALAVSLENIPSSRGNWKGRRSSPPHRSRTARCWA